MSGESELTEFAQAVAVELLQELPALRDMAALSAALAKITTTGGHVTFDDSPIVPLDEIERAYVVHVLAHFGGNKAQAADALGIDSSTLYRKLGRWGLR